MIVHAGSFSRRSKRPLKSLRDRPQTLLVSAREPRSGAARSREAHGSIGDGARCRAALNSSQRPRAATTADQKRSPCPLCAEGLGRRLKLVDGVVDASSMGRLVQPGQLRPVSRWIGVIVFGALVCTPSGCGNSASTTTPTGQAQPSRGAVSPRAVAPSVASTTKPAVKPQASRGAVSPRAVASSVASTTKPAVKRQASPGAVSPRAVARSVAMYYARIAANEDEPATTGEVRQLATALAATCSAAEYGQYPCAVRPPNHTPSAVQRCAAIVGARGRVLTLQCRGDGGPAPINRPGYVDCTSVGHVVSISDPAGDASEQALGQTSTVPIPAAGASADLLRLRVAATATRFCVDIQTAKPLREGSLVQLALHTPGTVVPGLEPSIEYRRSSRPVVEDGNGAISARLGHSGSWTSVVITAADLGTPGSRPIGRHFVFSVRSLWELGTPGDPQATVDEAPDGGAHSSYP
jgi:hypothetical protein